MAIPEEEEVDYQLKYLVPAKGIAKTTNIFIPIVKKGLEDEVDGMENLLLSEKDQTASTKKILDKLELFETNNKLHELLILNYSDKKISSRENSTNAIKRVSLRTNRPHSNNLNRSFQRLSSNSPNPNDNSFQKLQRIYLGNSFFKGSEEGQSILDSTCKDSSEVDLRVVTDPGIGDNSEPILKDFVLQIETKSSLNRFRPKLQMDPHNIKKSLKLIPKNKEALKPFHYPVKATSSSKLSVKRIPSEENPSATIPLSDERLKAGTNLKVEASCEVSIDGSISNITKITLNNSGHNLQSVNLKESFESLSQNHNLSHVVTDIAERRNLKPFRSSMEGNLKKFFKKSALIKERSQSPEIKKNLINSSFESLNHLDKLKIKQKAEEKVPTMLPPRPKKDFLVGNFQPVVRPSSSLKPRVTFDENTQHGNKSFTSGESKERMVESSMIITKEALRNSDISGNNRSSSVGREDRHKQKLTLLKKIADVQ